MSWKADKTSAFMNHPTYVVRAMQRDCDRRTAHWWGSSEVHNKLGAILKKYFLMSTCMVDVICNRVMQRLNTWCGAEGRVMSPWAGDTLA